MTRTILAMALLAGVSSLALAQTSTTPSTGGGATTTQQTPSTGGTGATGTTGGTTGTTGATRAIPSMSDTQIKSQLESQGYSNVTLQPDPSKQGQHKGTATKAGKQVQIHVDENGRVTEQQ